MNVDRAAMRGRLAELEDRARRLTLKIEGLSTALRSGLNTALMPVAEWPPEHVPTLAGQWAELEAAYAELVGVESRQARLTRELG